MNDDMLDRLGRCGQLVPWLHKQTCQTKNDMSFCKVTIAFACFGLDCLLGVGFVHYPSISIIFQPLTLYSGIGGRQRNVKWRK